MGEMMANHKILMDEIDAKLKLEDMRFKEGLSQVNAGAIEVVDGHFSLAEEQKNAVLASRDTTHQYSMLASQSTIQRVQHRMDTCQQEMDRLQHMKASSAHDA